MNIQRGILPDADPVLWFDVEGVGRLDAEGVVGDIQTTVIGDVLAKRKAALADADNLVVGILLIGRDVHREQKVVVFLSTTAEKFLTCADGVKLSDVGLDRGSTFRIQSCGVHHQYSSGWGSSRPNDRSRIWRSRLQDAQWCPCRRN